MLVRHYKGGIYKFIGTATPVIPMIMNSQRSRYFKAFHTELEEEITIQSIDNMYLTSKDHKLVIHESIAEGIIYARPVEMFWEVGYFTDPDILEHRFAIIDGDLIDDRT